MPNDEPPRAEPVDQLLGRMDRASQTDLVAQRGQAAPAGEGHADVHDAGAAALEHRAGLDERRPARPSECRQHVGHGRAVLRPERVPAVHHHAGAARRGGGPGGE